MRPSEAEPLIAIAPTPGEALPPPRGEEVTETEEALPPPRGEAVTEDMPETGDVATVSGGGYERTAPSREEASRMAVLDESGTTVGFFHLGAASPERMAWVAATTALERSSTARAARCAAMSPRDVASSSIDQFFYGFSSSEG